ncbi:hypothetical protein SESBI_44340 [Sesbania bispinosa]|nr:hypothetical protein SESBI_44340 [Sesbania bispinosa]
MAEKWWALFNNFEGPEGSEVASIFDRRFPVEQLIARDFNKKEDRSRVNKVGMRNDEFEETKKSYEVKYTEMEAKCSTAVSEQTRLKKDLDDTIAEKEKLTQELDEVVAQKKQLVEEKARSDLDIDALQKEMALQHARGFHKQLPKYSV